MTEEFAEPIDVAKRVREMAGDLYPRTSIRKWAETVTLLETCARAIEQRVLAPDTDTAAVRRRPTKANPDAPGGGYP